MTEKEVLGILATLKAAYPQQLNKLSETEAGAMIKIWQAQFDGIPANILLLAIHKVIATSQYFPTIAEIKEKIKSLYHEAQWALMQDDQARRDDEFAFGTKLSKEVRAKVEYIYNNTYDNSEKNVEPQLFDMIGASMRGDEIEFTKEPLLLENTEDEDV